jgi:iron complex outermembrane receptor protein
MKTLIRPRLSRALALALAACVIGWVGPADAEEAPVEWDRTLARLESELPRLDERDSSSLARFALEIVSLAQDVEAWIAAHPEIDLPSAAAPPLAASRSDTVGVEALAVALARLKARISTVRASAGDSPLARPFHLGVVEVTVTADVAARASAVTVLDADQLWRHDRRVVASALDLATGVTLTRAGSRNEASVSVRGFDLRQVPLYVDGIPVYVPYDGYVDLDRLVTSDLAEVRLTKGFSSVLYGPNALGGTVNLVTRQPRSAFEGDAGASLHSARASTAHANLGSRLESWYLQASGSRLAADGYPLSRAFVPTTAEDGGLRENARRDDSKLSLKTAWTPNSRNEYSLSYVRQRGEKGNPPYAGDDPRVRVRYWRWPYVNQDSLYFISTSPLGERLRMKARAYYDAYENALFSYDDASYATQSRPLAFRSYYDDDTVGASSELTARLGRHTLSGALHIKQDVHREHNEGEPIRRFEDRVASLAIEDVLRLGARVSAIAGLSFDHLHNLRADDFQNGKVGSLPGADSQGVNPQLAVGFQPFDDGAFRLSIARRTRLPSLKARYSYRLGRAIPNPDLQPEQSLNLEAAFQGALFGAASLTAAVFHSRISEMAQAVVVEPNVTQLRNVGDVNHTGFEIELGSRTPGRLEARVGYSFLHRQNRTDPPVPLVDTPKHKLFAAAQLRPTRALAIVGSLRWDSGRLSQNDAGRVDALRGSATIDLKASFLPTPSLTVEAGVTNLLDESYVLAEGYPEPGRTLAVNLRYRWSKRHRR